MTLAQTWTANRFDSAHIRARWTGERIARLGFLIGLGWEAKEVAEDPIVQSTPNNVHRQAQRFGLAFRAAKQPFGGAHVKLAAEKRHLTTEALGRLLLREIAADPHLIDNILDDDYPPPPLQPSNKDHSDGIFLR